MAKKNGFTLIEILIAIVIFGIGILTIVFLIVQNIGLVDKIKNKNMATFLAREGIEIAYNLKDTNLDRGVLWKCISLDENYNCVQSLSPGTHYKVNLDNYGYYNISSTSSDYEDNILYFHTGLLIDKLGNKLFNGMWYDYDPSGKKTIFSRTLYFTGVYLEPQGGVGDVNKIMKIESRVLYNKGGNKSEVVLESFIGETR